MDFGSSSTAVTVGGTSSGTRGEVDGEIVVAASVGQCLSARPLLILSRRGTPWLRNPVPRITRSLVNSRQQIRQCDLILHLIFLQIRFQSLPRDFLSSTSL